MIPNLRAYDPAFAFEVAMIVKDGLQRMYEKEEDVFYYLTLYNENISHPPMPEGVEEGIIKGLYLFRPASAKLNHHVQLFGSGSIMPSRAEGAGAARGKIQGFGRCMERHQLSAIAE